MKINEGNKKRKREKVKMKVKAIEKKNKRNSGRKAWVYQIKIVSSVTDVKVSEKRKKEDSKRKEEGNKWKGKRKERSGVWRKK